MKSILLVLFITLTNIPVANDASMLITTAQINQLLGCNLKDGKTMMNGKYHSHQSADFKTQVIVQYTTFSNDKTATQMLKLAHNENMKNIADGKKAVGIYTAGSLFPEAGEGAYYLTAPGNDFSPGSQVRFQFVAGSSLVSFDTQNIDMNKVIARLQDICKIINENYK